MPIMPAQNIYYSNNFGYYPIMHPQFHNVIQNPSVLPNYLPQRNTPSGNSLNMSGYEYYPYNTTSNNQTYYRGGKDK